MAQKVQCEIQYSMNEEPKRKGAQLKDIRYGTQVRGDLQCLVYSHAVFHNGVEFRTVTAHHLWCDFSIPLTLYRRRRLFSCAGSPRHLAVLHRIHCISVTHRACQRPAHENKLMRPAPSSQTTTSSGRKPQLFKLPQSHDRFQEHLDPRRPLPLEAEAASTDPRCMTTSNAQ